MKKPIAILGFSVLVCQSLCASISRSEVPLEEKWNLESLYESVDLWEKDFAQLYHRGWHEFETYKGRFHEGPDVLRRFLDLYFAKQLEIERLREYAARRQDEDLSNPRNKRLFERCDLFARGFSEALSWVNCELLELDNDLIESYKQSEELADYATYIAGVFDKKAYTLPREQEKLLKRSLAIRNRPYRAFSALEGIDLQFPSIKGADGEDILLTEGTFGKLLADPCRSTRKQAFENMYRRLGRFENTLCELLNMQLQAHLFVKEARGFDSCVDAALRPNQVPVEVYDNLVNTVRKNLHVVHKLMAIKKRALGLEKMHHYDLKMPILTGDEITYSYENAREIVLESLAPLGDGYREILSRGLYDERWVDVRATKNKRSGGYSAGCYDSYPFILLNFQGSGRDLLTLSHEAGHSMHTYLSAKNQPYQYADYPIFLAEIASTFNEQLTFDYLLKRVNSKQERIVLLDRILCDLRSTFFRQTMFAEFELKIHKMVERGEPVTPEELKRIYRQLNVDYFGPDVEVDEGISVEFLRVPHFYYNFYVYQYATGVAAAHALAKKVIKGEKSDKDAYFKFLSAGGSRKPIELLKEVGVDMTDPKVIESFIFYFEGLVQELERELDEK